MPESIRDANFYNPCPPREERMRVFLSDHLLQQDRDTAQDMAFSFEDLSQPMAKTAVLIPVAAHQDSGHIFHTLGEYAKQQNCDPFTVLLNLNAPDNNKPEINAGFEASQAMVTKAREAFPQLDVRMATQRYGKPIIGEVRRDLWNAALMLAYHEGLFSQDDASDVIGINNDIDTQFISPHYIGRIQEHYNLSQKRAAMVGVPHAVQNAVGTRVTHATLDSHPNVGKVTQWIDNTYFQSLNHVSYEAGIVIPFSFYTLAGGFDPNDATYETHWAVVASGGQLQHVTAAQLYTSPRRYINHLNNPDATTEKVWTPETFGHSDDCRDMLKPDISAERAEDVILSRLNSDLHSYWLPRAIMPVVTFAEQALAEELNTTAYSTAVVEQTHQGVSRQLQKAERLLRYAIKSHVLADIVRDNFNGSTYADETAISLIAVNRALRANKKYSGGDLVVRLK